MKRTTCRLVCLVICLMLLPAVPMRAEAGRFDMRYEPGFAPHVYAVDPGGVGEPLVMRIQGNLLLLLRVEVDAETPLTLTLFDLAEGMALAETSLDDLLDYNWEEGVGLTLDGRPYALMAEGVGVRFYNQALEQTEEYRFPALQLCISTWLSPSGDRLWCFDPQRREVVGVELASGRQVRLKPGLQKEWHFSGFWGMKGDSLLFSMTDGAGNTALYDFDTQTEALNFRPVMPGFSGIPFSLPAQASVQGDIALFGEETASGDLYRPHIWRTGEYLWQRAGALVLSQLPGVNGSLRVYDLSAGLLLGELPNSIQQTNAIMTAQLVPRMGAVLLTTYEGPESISNYYLWDYAAAPLNLDAQVEKTTLAIMRAGNDDLALQIAQNQDVKVHLRQNGLSFENDTYEAGALLDEVSIRMALEGIQRFFQALPEGLLTEALRPDYSKLDFYLVGAIRRRGTEGLPTAMGVAAVTGEERYIVATGADLGTNANLAHEIMHILEDRLLDHDEETGGQGISNWLQLSPAEWEEGGYAFRYLDEEGNQLYDASFTAEDLSSPAEQPIYYVDAYSRTFPLEDRARIFEKLFAAQDELPPELLHPHVLRKAHYLCWLLRQAFPTLRHAPTLPWERLLPPDATDWRTYFDQLENAA